MIKLAWSGLSKREKRRLRGKIRALAVKDPGFYPVIHRFARLVSDATLELIAPPVVETREETVYEAIAALKLKLGV